MNPLESRWRSKLRNYETEGKQTLTRRELSAESAECKVAQCSFRKCLFGFDSSSRRQLARERKRERSTAIDDYTGDWSVSPPQRLFLAYLCRWTWWRSRISLKSCISTRTRRTACGTICRRTVRTWLAIARASRNDASRIGTRSAPAWT